MALEHLVVLDLTHMLSGPYGTMLLADLGARTIKIEPPMKGEATRRLLEHDHDYSVDGMGAYFLTLNRNKESLSLDLKQEAGKRVFMDLVKMADVVFDNFSVGVTKRLGIDHDALVAINPRIITCSVTGFGETGSFTDYPAFDQVVQAMGGGMSITGSSATGPLRSGIPIGDLGGGLFGAMGVLAALAEREQTGRGQHIDVSMLDGQVSLLNYMATMHLMSGIVPQGIGNSHFVHVPYDSFSTLDGHIIIACIGDDFFERFAQCMGISELLKPEYKEQPVRFAAREKINNLIHEKIKKNSTAHWLKHLREARVPCAPVNDFKQALNSPQIRERDMVIDVTLPSGKTVSMPGNPIKLSSGTKMTYTAPPAVGQESRKILNELLSYSEEYIDQLIASQVTG